MNQSMGDLPVFNLSQSLDSNGVTVNVQVFPIRSDNPSTDQIILTIPNYISLVLTNSSQTLRVNVLDSSNSVVQSVSFARFRFRFQFWTAISVSLSQKLASLKVDGTTVDSYATNFALPGTTPRTFQLQTAQDLTYLISSLNVQDSASKSLLDLNFT